MKIASLFAGVGGIDKGFKDLGNLVYANEIDKNAVATFELNFPIKADNRDIKKVKIKEIPDFDILLAGFPCQAFSVAGYRKGFEDERGELYFDIVRILRAKKPSIVFLENVKNLVSHNKGNTFNIIMQSLHDLGYHVKYSILNACEYGNVPQNRERIYIVAFKSKNTYKNFNFPMPIPLTTKISDIVKFNQKVDDKYYYTSDGCYFYDELKQSIINKNTLYQWRRKYVRENKSNLCPTLTANMGTGGHNVPLTLTKYGIRKLTPKECFRFQGFSDNFILPDIANTHLYKQAGNSVCVSVIRNIAKEIQKAI